MDKIHIEVVRSNRHIAEDDLKCKLTCYLRQLNWEEVRGEVLDCNEKNSSELADYVQKIIFDSNFKVPFIDEEICFHIYRICDRTAEVETLESDVSENFEEIPASNHWLLPTKDFLGLWETLLYDEGLKENILRFMEIALKYSMLEVNANIISCNRIVLLHGPPGTGKTSLCRALAQKISVRLLSVFKNTHLIEINSHSLFSKWFSESGKLVMKLFNKIRDLISQPKSLVCVLIDEVESLAYARESISGGEPRDALRVVNALLTQLDQIKNYPNVLILTTSNLTSKIDLAFIDRADIKQYIGNPSVRAIYEIYRSAIKELIRVGIISDCKTTPSNFMETAKVHEKGENEVNLELQKLAERSLGLSGRILKKIPFIAHAFYLNCERPTIFRFLSAIEAAVGKEFREQNLLGLGEHLK